MPQKLSAIRYLKNNKRRAAVLIVSLALCFMLTYISQFLLSSTTETFRTPVMENPRKIQYVYLSGETLGIDFENLEQEMLIAEYARKNAELAEKLKKHDGVKNVYCFQIVYCRLTPVVGGIAYEVPLGSKEEITELMEYMGVGLSEGRLPEAPGEIVLDGASMKNNRYELNDYLNENDYGEKYRIVGILDGDSYFGCGIRAEEIYTDMITILSDIADISAELRTEGIEVRENYDTVVDLKWGENFLKTEVEDVIGNSTVFIYVGILILLSISLLVVYTMYLRDRRNEWCLYCSIGYSRKTIYFAIVRELLFTFGAALVIGGAVTALSVVLLDHLIIREQGLRCRYFYPQTLWEMICSYVMILGILQIPLRYALYKIRTIDAIDDDLY